MNDSQYTAAFLDEWQAASDTVLLHTSGSTGAPKVLRVEKRRMEASARRTCRFLGLKRGDVALLCLPTDYIAGKMMVVRSIVAGMQLISVPPSAHPLREVPDTQHIDFAAMVPMQVARAIDNDAECRRLRAIRHLIIGGGAIDAALAEALRTFPNHVWSTYGMTETLSHIAMRQLNGPSATDAYTPLDGIRVGTDADGCLWVEAPDTCDGRLHTHDLVRFDPQGRFRILGRTDNVVCSGGVKLQIEQLEAALAGVLPVPFVLTKVRDTVLGEALTLLYVDDAASPALRNTVENACRQKLPRHHTPRHYLPVKQLPSTPNGKPARKEAERMANERLTLSAS